MQTAIQAVTAVIKELDRAAASLGPEYSAGGVEYYTKILESNMALRELQGEAGRAKYNRHGDIIQVEEETRDIYKRENQSFSP